MSGTTPQRQYSEINLATVERGKITIKLYDRITVDDVFMHLVSRHLYELVTGETLDMEVDPKFKDFLVRERYSES